MARATTAEARLDGGAEDERAGARGPHPSREDYRQEGIRRALKASRATPGTAQANAAVPGTQGSHRSSEHGGREVQQGRREELDRGVTPTRRRAAAATSAEAAECKKITPRRGENPAPTGEKARAGAEEAAWGGRARREGVTRAHGEDGLKLERAGEKTH